MQPVCCHGSAKKKWKWQVWPYAHSQSRSFHHAISHIGISLWKLKTLTWHPRHSIRARLHFGFDKASEHMPQPTYNTLEIPFRISRNTRWNKSLLHPKFKSQLINRQTCIADPPSKALKETRGLFPGIFRVFPTSWDGNVRLIHPPLKKTFVKLPIPPDKAIHQSVLTVRQAIILNKLGIILFVSLHNARTQRVLLQESRQLC